MGNRRAFLQTAGGLMILEPRTAFGSQANSALQVGVIGCGGRGNYIGDFFIEHTNSRITGAADPFEDRLTAAKQRLKAEAVFGGLNGYSGLLQSKIDAVVITSPPYYHPEHVAAALESRKHVFLAKPAAVDVPGCQSISESGRKAQGKLSFVVDFQTRVQPVFVEAAERVKRGDIGRPVLGHVYYHANRLRPQDKPGMKLSEARLRNWVFDKVLSGDIIVEQNVHVIDMANWYLEGHPVRAFGTGGRQARVDVGDCWDHFLVTYWYPNDAKVDFSSAQFTKGYNDLCARIYGTGGTVDSPYGGAVGITGDHPWSGTGKDDTFRQGAITNVKNFVESIRTGKFLNNVQESVSSTLTAILGRTAAYTGREVTWDEMIGSGDKLEANLTL
jgi:predicted dehydrogenase